MSFKVLITIFIIYFFFQSVVGGCINTVPKESSSIVGLSTLDSDQPCTTTIKPMIASSVTTTSPPTTKSGQEVEEELVQKLRLYLTLLDQHIKLSGRPRFGRSVPLILPIETRLSWSFWSSTSSSKFYSFRPTYSM